MKTKDYKPSIGSCFLTTKNLYVRLNIENDLSIAGIRENSLITVVDNSSDIWAKILEPSGRCSYLYHTWWRFIKSMRIG